ncbi:hypothetical protein DB30_00289 [Enhygromyxa salina]|uniref:Uncharacterized protein n=1 Tax=Enhygromyxa salina TaxID=215803 RepID=A0A0C1ZM93_9BACT|nr:hypothetical protein [Enhygromyxa salina]KIG18604.1 hypothetical protein DB30_00289 [Enhygromyxa salina]
MQSEIPKLGRAISMGLALTACGDRAVIEIGHDSTGEPAALGSINMCDG